MTGKIDKYEWIDLGSSYVPSEISCAGMTQPLSLSSIFPVTSLTSDFPPHFITSLPSNFPSTPPPLPVATCPSLLHYYSPSPLSTTHSRYYSPSPSLSLSIPLQPSLSPSLSPPLSLHQCYGANWSTAPKSPPPVSPTSACTQKAFSHTTKRVTFASPTSPQTCKGTPTFSS